MIKLIFGEDTFSIKKEITKSTSCSDCEITRVREDLNLFINEVLSSSFFSKKRVFICFELISKLNETEQKKIIETLNKKPSDTTILFIEEKEPKGPIGRYLKKEAEKKHYPKPTEKEIISFINNEVKENGTTISPLAAERLASFVGPDYWQLSEEVKKLVLFKKEDNSDEGIQTADVEEIVKSNLEANIFELMDAISDKNQRRGMRLLTQFLDSGENEIYIFLMVARQFRNIAIAKFDGFKNEKEFAKNAGIHPYVAKKSINQARNFTKEEIIKIYKRLVEIDFDLKSGTDPKHALERMLF